MKKLITVFIAIAIAAGAYAQADSTSKKMSHPDKNQTNYGTPPNQDNKSATQNRDNNSGTIQNRDNNSGTTQKQDNNSSTNQNWDMNTQNQNVQTNSVDKSHPDGVMMQNGKMVQIKNGQTSSLQNDEVTLSNGTKISSDGTCLSKDGTKTTMKEGQHLDMAGNMIPMKTNKDKNMYLVPDSTRK